MEQILWRVRNVGSNQITVTTDYGASPKLRDSKTELRPHCPGPARFATFEIYNVVSKSAIVITHLYAAAAHFHEYEDRLVS